MINRLQEKRSGVKLVQAKDTVVYSFIPYVARSSKISSKDNVHSTDIESMLGKLKGRKKSNACKVKKS
jgi:hypothetical protein